MANTTTQPPDHLRLTRIRLSNGYRAYCPASAAPPPAKKPEKRVRFVKGFVTEPTTLREPSPPRFAGPGARRVTWEQQDPERPEQQEPFKNAVQQERKRRAPPPSGGRYMEGPSGPAVWRVEPRHRAGGALMVVDDALRDGMALARDGVGLPCDRWREPVAPGGARVGIVRVGSNGDEGHDGAGKRGEEMGWLGEGERLRYEDGEREGGFSLRDIVRNEEAVTVRVVEKPGRRGRAEEEEDEKVESLGEDEVDAFAAVSVHLTDGESEDGESLPDLCAEEPLGWVLVMEVEEVEGEDWMSLHMAWRPVALFGDKK
ncbi:hypothetical protein VTJ83DRAFT_5355 [Remersonia thermophila]|uniref:Uncharacterized protein n=1 Tax=Remersonia thermophila TaxID=72144 RepID=A0ABR4D6L1_9PEZI